MSVRVTLPPGCEGFSGKSGFRTQDARAGSTITVSDDVARRIEGNYGGDGGLVQATNRTFAGTKKGRWCQACKPVPRLWNAWTAECPHGHGPTVPEE